MGDPEIRALVAGEEACVVLDIDTIDPLPLARARNLGAAEARRRGAEVLVFLDVDCIPSASLVGRYATLAGTDAHRYGVLCGTVSYLPPGFTGHNDADLLEQFGVPHSARPAPRACDVVRTDEYELFWSLSFAISAHAWEQLDGFCEDYTGYGGEDTDFGQCAQAAGMSMYWVGGATAYHQHHPVSDPPVEHLTDILRNGETFANRWGWWPMRGWLDSFERQGLVVFDEVTHTWRETVGGQRPGFARLAVDGARSAAKRD